MSREDHILKSVNHALDDFNRRLVHFPSDPGIKKIECAVGEERTGVCGDVIAIIRRLKDHKKFILFDARSADYPIDKMAVAGGSSGHGIQNDDATSIKWMEAVEKYLDKYMPVQQEKSLRG